MSETYAQRQARSVLEGEACMTCGAYRINLFRKPGGPVECAACRRLREPGETAHPEMVRCPRCRHVFSLTTYASENAEYRYYEDGEHIIECPECERTFAVRTVVSYLFGSQAVDPKEPIQ